MVRSTGDHHGRVRSERDHPTHARQYVVRSTGDHHGWVRSTGDHPGHEYSWSDGNQVETPVHHSLVSDKLENLRGDNRY